MLFFRLGFPIQVLELCLLSSLFIFSPSFDQHSNVCWTAKTTEPKFSPYRASAGRPKNRHAVPGRGRRFFRPPKYPEQLWLPPSQPLHL